MSEQPRRVRPQMPNWVSLIVGFLVAYAGSVAGRLAILAATGGSQAGRVLILAQWPFIALGAYYAARRGRTAGWVYGGAIGLAFTWRAATAVEWALVAGTVAAGLLGGVAGQRHRR